MKIIMILFSFIFLACIPPKPGENGTLESRKKSKVDVFVLSDSIAKAYAENAGNQIKNECIKYNLGVEIKDFDVTIMERKTDKTDRKYIMKIRISWEGGITGVPRWIEGKIVCDEDGNNAFWEKINSDCIGCACPNSKSLSCLRY
jgi:hypothetical protein